MKSSSALCNFCFYSEKSVLLGFQFAVEDRSESAETCSRYNEWTEIQFHHQLLWLQYQKARTFYTEELTQRMCTNGLALRSTCHLQNWDLMVRCELSRTRFSSIRDAIDESKTQSDFLSKQKQPLFPTTKLREKKFKYENWPLD